MEFEKSLNKKQYEAVANLHQNVRVIAGAGTGKTRVLTYRVAYLISELGIDPWEILAITFTNKAAKEMLERVTTFFPDYHGNLWVSTFHSFCARFLRYEIKALDFPSNFHILDDQDQESIIKKIMSNRGYKKTGPETKLAITFINGNKSAGHMPDDAVAGGFPRHLQEMLVEVFEEYEYEKTRAYSLDFNDLILKTIKILREFPDIGLKWQHRFKHILVDEFQDTDEVQYSLLKLLLTENTNFYVVGDPDQTIYTWRGANQEIIINLEQDFPNLATVVLEKNYRSTQNVLDAANSLIAFNSKRIHKDLESANGYGRQIETRYEQTAASEASYICRTISDLVSEQGFQYSDIAILYRSNYLSLNLEKQLMRYRIPYTLFGNIKFYQRAEIKNAMAYLNLVDRIQDDLSFLRIINVPRRGFGDVATESLTEGAKKHDMFLTQYIQSEFIESEMKSKHFVPLRELIKQIEIMQDLIFKYQSSGQSLDDTDDLKTGLTGFFTDIGFIKYLDECTDNPEDRRENIDALIQDILNFMARDNANSFSEYLQNVSLLSHQDEIDNSNCVKLMTVHIAKGLEFPVIFIFSFNEGVFPSRRSVEEGGVASLEEERRLAYVAITRAMTKLHITYNTEYSFVTKNVGIPSSFLSEANIITASKKEIAKSKFRDFFEEQRKAYQKEVEAVEESENRFTTNDVNWNIGDRLTHIKFGSGTVMSIEKNGIIVVSFDEAGEKKLLGAHHTISKGE